LEKLLNPGIEKGTAGVGSQTGLQPPPDNSFDRRADFAAAHRARLSTPKGFSEAPQTGYVGREPLPAEGSPLAGIDKELAEALGYGGEEEGPPALPSPGGKKGESSGLTGASATVRALETLLREGRPEFVGKPWAPHRPPRPEKTEGG